VEFGNGTPAETRELSEDSYLDVDDSGHLVSITIEHASQLGELSEVSFIRMNSNNILEATA
jgi:uncharacterized protein YuzE